MSNSTTDKCPFCGSPLFIRAHDNYDRYHCGTQIGEEPWQGVFCKINCKDLEIDRLKALLRRSATVFDAMRETDRLNLLYPSPDSVAQIEKEVLAVIKSKEKKCQAT